MNVRRLLFCVYLLLTWQAACWGYDKGLQQLNSGQRPNIWLLNRDIPYVSIATPWLTSEWFALAALLVGIAGLILFGRVCLQHQQPPMSSSQFFASLVLRWLIWTASITALCYTISVLPDSDIRSQAIATWITDRLSQPPDWLTTISRIGWGGVGIYLLTLLIDRTKFVRVPSGR